MSRKQKRQATKPTRTARAFELTPDDAAEALVQGRAVALGSRVTLYGAQSPTMIVAGVDGRRVRCVWFAADGGLQKASFAPALLGVLPTMADMEAAKQKLADAERDRQQKPALDEPSDDVDESAPAPKKRSGKRKLAVAPNPEGGNDAAKDA
jgi:uncharacterized protein YodC (DUF2158 family)